MFRGRVCSNGLLGVRFNLFLVVVARFTGLRGKPSVMNLITMCKKAAAAAPGTHDDEGQCQPHGSICRS